jgi:hypothetical protein
MPLPLHVLLAIAVTQGPFAGADHPWGFALGMVLVLPDRWQVRSRAEPRS